MSRSRQRGALGWLLLLGAMVWVGCGEESPATPDNAAGPGTDGPGANECVPDDQFFLREVWTPILHTSCFNCHNPLGIANDTDMVYQDSGQVGFLDHNLEVFQDVAAFERDGTSVVLLKPTMQISHVGGKLFDVDSEQYKALVEMVRRSENPSQCGSDSADLSFFEEVEVLTPEETLRKATLNMVGRLPTLEENELVASGGVQGLEAVLDRVMREENFYDRMEEIFNDRFLTNKYLGGNNAIDLLNTDFYPEARWYDEDNITPSNSLDPQFLDAARRLSNNAVAAEPLRLVTHILRNDKSFTEILTADYIVVNPFSARIYGIDDIDWTDPLDTNEYREGKIEGIPHAGILTSPMFLNRFPTTDTNRNRHRSRMVYEFFLATDILKLGERPIDPTSTVHNPTMNDPQCSGCHAVIDPVAGSFQNWDPSGNFDPPDSWFTDLREPGFGPKTISGDERLNSLQWLGNRIVEDPRFAQAIVRTMYTGITGLQPLTLPQANGERHDQELRAYETQQEVFDQFARDFAANDFNLRRVIKDIVQSPYFRATGSKTLEGDRLIELDQLGTGRLLTPEQLNRKIGAVVGYPWRERADRGDYLLSERDYLILYGGIDSDDVTERITEPNGIMFGIQQRLANELTCRFVARDFVANPENRRLFPFVERSFIPEDDNGFDIPQSIEAVRKNIQHLHWHVLGEKLDINDPEINFTYDLFYETWQEGRENILAEEVSSQLDNDCRASSDFWTGTELTQERKVESDPNYTVRAWTAVLTYLLMDYKFLYE